MIAQEQTQGFYASENLSTYIEKFEITQNQLFDGQMI
jgi:hypothetical protein